MSKIKNYFIFTVIGLIVFPFIAFAQNNTNSRQNQTVIKPKVEKHINRDAEQSKSLWVITPQEINLGTISPDKSGEVVFTLKSAGPVIDWSTEGPEGWKKLENKKLSGVLENKSDALRVEIRLLPKESLINEDKLQNLSNYLEMKLEAGGGKLVCRKEFAVGPHKESIKISSGDIQKTIFVTFTIAYTQKAALINLNPLRLDMGCILQEKTISKKIMVTNSGKEMLKWSVMIPKHEKKDIPNDFKKSRYISFFSEEARETGIYTIPGYLRETMELTGNWRENNGYPTRAEGEGFIKIRFSGTGIILYLSAYQEDEVNMAISLDKNPIDKIELLEDLEANKGELLIAKELADGPHVLTIISKDSCLVFEGVKILGIRTAHFPEGSIKIVPNAGATTRQTNYLNISLNTGQMSPGYYVDDIVFNTNGGEAVVEVFAEVLNENISKVIDVYRYYNGKDYLFTANPQAETKRLYQNNYVKEGIAFRLFKPDTPGTTGFYRWYSPQIKGHFYYADSSGGKKDLRGYILEGSIGNIATSRMTNTRELYRWCNLKTGHYFYSTDIQGGKINKKIYHFDGIAGYVK